MPLRSKTDIAVEVLSHVRNRDMAGPGLDRMAQEPQHENHR
jgi:hypothetical protein